MHLLNAPAVAIVCAMIWGLGAEVAQRCIAVGWHQHGIIEHCAWSIASGISAARED